MSATSTPSQECSGAGKKVKWTDIGLSGEEIFVLLKKKLNVKEFVNVFSADTIPLKLLKVGSTYTFLTSFIFEFLISLQRMSKNSVYVHLEDCPTWMKL